MILTYIFIIILLLVLLYGINKMYKGCKLVYEGSHPKRSKSLDLAQIPFKTRRFSFLSKDNINISAIEYIPNQPPRGTIIACHYLGGSKTAIYSYIEPLLYKGFTVVSFDYPNHGESMDRRGNKYTLEDDMRRFIIKIKELGIQGPYGTMGFSMGATIAISATDHLPEIKAIMVDSGPLIFVRDYFIYVLKSKNVESKIMKMVFLFFYLYVIGFYKMSRNMIKRLRKIRGIPIIIIHSKNDKIISYKNAEYTYRLLKSKRTKLVPVERAHHLTNRVILGNVYDELVINFFEKWLIDDTKTENY